MTLLIIAALCGALEVWILLIAGRRVVQVQDFHALPPQQLERYPSASIVIPACNEEATIAPALEQLGAQDYPDLELIVVNDRSSDETGALIDQAAARDPRIKAVHNDTLPSGWLGKVHALKLGQDASASEWILFTDADVHLAPQALKSAIAYAEHRGLDHLAVCPDLAGRSALANACVANFHLIMMVLVSPAKVRDPNRPDGVGVGAFNLVRRSCLEASEGFDWLRLEVADDFALGAVLKAAGGRCELVFGTQLAQVEWYPSVAAMIAGFEKNAYGALGHYRPWLALLKLMASVIPIALPLVALPWTSSSPWGWIAALAPLLASWLVGALLARRMRWPYTRYLVAPFTLPILWFALINGLIKSWQRGGVAWRGTLYATADLRAAQRIKL